jgi:hypothetical protein
MSNLSLQLEPMSPDDSSVQDDGAYETVHFSRSTEVPPIRLIGARYIGTRETEPAERSNQQSQDIRASRPAELGCSTQGHRDNEKVRSAIRGWAGVVFQQTVSRIQGFAYQQTVFGNQDIASATLRWVS